MLKQRQLLEKELAAIFSNFEDTKQKQEYYKELESRFNIPIDMSSDIISMRKYLSEYNEFVLFAITSVIDENKIKLYFTEREIEMYSNQTYKIPRIAPQLHIPMFRVADDQWIGVTDVHFLMALRGSQAINYNSNTQRALEAVVRGKKVVYIPSVDYRAVNEIAEAYAENRFIPNTISLNIDVDDEDTELIFEDNVLHIRKFKSFDIFDGYHRYLAMARNYDADHDFNYPVELRITNFSVTKAKQFIWQEDHKTKMKKVDAASFDQYNAGNIIVDRLNKDPDFNLYDRVNLSDGLIHSGLLSIAINRYYFNTRNKVDRKDIIKVFKNLKAALNQFTEEYDKYLEKRWEKYEIWTIVYGIYTGHPMPEISQAIKNYNNEQIRIINKSSDLMKKQKDIIKEVYCDV